MGLKQIYFENQRGARRSKGEERLISSNMLQQTLHNLHNRICDNIFKIISKVEENKCVSVKLNMPLLQYNMILT
jgi:hypothetical protein